MLTADIDDGQRYVRTKFIIALLHIPADLRDLGAFADIAICAGAKLPDQVFGGSTDVCQLIHYSP